MDSLTDDDKTQRRSLASHLSTQQETIVERWMMKCLQTEARLPFACFSHQEFTEEIRALLSLFIQNVLNESQTRDLGERISQFHHLQGKHSLEEWAMALANFYDVLSEHILLFLEHHPQIQPRVITQVFSQLLQLLQQVNSDNYSRPESAIHRVKQLRQVEHDLRSTFGILSTVASLLQRPLKTDDRAKYLDMLHRNVNAASNLLNRLLAYSPFEEVGES
ncbi:hypothetical protein [Spirosoma foliorum]|uniref:Uncharacterized protein n=1 Tax=Spirosoma foliorum TaxID=2710596 RepID=A0A7G5H540_9BACT|nr:hypothetical protein [Spirosoma foliorum]QMW06232.1 hypothetical protein H3H32_15760 [Spirosoma foliorum]